MPKQTKTPIRRSRAQLRADNRKELGKAAARLNAQQGIVLPPAATEKPSWSKYVLWINHPGFSPPDGHH